MINGRQAPPRVVRRPVGQLTIRDLILAYLRFADGYYRKNGEPTGEYDSIRHSLKPLRRLYGQLGVSDFGPLALKAVRDELIKADLCRNEINKRVGRMVRMFKWGVENEYVDPMTHHALSQVRGLSRGRSAARESKPVKPVPDASVDPLRADVSRQVWAMIELQRTTGMRPGEVCIIRTGDIDHSRAVWVYRPETHKTEHHVPICSCCRWVFAPRLAENLAPRLSVADSRRGSRDGTTSGPRRRMTTEGGLVVFEAKRAEGDAPLIALTEGLDYLAGLYRVGNFEKIRSGFAKWMASRSYAVPDDFQGVSPDASVRPTLVILAPEKYFTGRHAWSIRGKDWPALGAVGETFIPSVRVKLAATDFHSTNLWVPPLPARS